MDDDLIALHGDEPKLMPYLHLPFQAGSDRILTAMNRKHTARDYAELVERIRAARPDIALSTDIIVGFPARPTPTSKTPWRSSAASALPAPSPLNIAPVPARRQRACRTRCRTRIARERLHILQSLLDEEAKAFDAATVGRKLKVLFERQGGNQDRSPGVHPISRPCMGRARGFDRPDRGC
mgnify:CR=1 FL=1